MYCLGGIGTMYKLSKAHFRHLIYARCNKDSIYAIVIAVSFILKEILAHFAPYTPPKNNLE
jgi:hypothetical protein